MLGRFRRGPARTLLGQLLWEHKWALGAAIGISALAFLAQIALGQAAVAAIDRGVTERTEPLGPLMLRVGVLGAIHVTVASLGVLLMTRVRWHVEYRVRTVLHRSLVTDAVDDADAATGQVVTRAVTDLGQVNRVVYLVPILVAGVPAVLSGMVYLGYLNFPLMLVTFSSLPINLLLVRSLRSKVWRLSWLQLQETAEVTRAVDEPIRGIRVVKLFGRERAVLSGVRLASQRAYAFAMARVRVLARSSAALKLAPAFSQAALLLIGARAIEGGSLTSGEFLVFFVGSGQVVFFAESFVHLLDGWAFARTGSNRIGELVDPEGVGVGNRMVAEEEPTDVDALFGPVHGGWACRDLVLTDEAGTTDPVSFAVLPGEVVVVQVPPALSPHAVCAAFTGAASAAAGSVRLEDVALHDAPRAAGAATRVLDSEPYLFARSVRDNLLLAGAGGQGPTAVGADDLDAVLRIACADEVVDSFTSGLDEVLGDRGMNLSGGQRQRLALAGALLARPRALFLVEALSGVHRDMEAAILGNLRRDLPETAVIYLTSRPSAAEAADRVERVVLGAPAGLVPSLPAPTPSAATLAATPGPVTLDKALFESEPEPALAALAADGATHPVDELVDYDEHPRCAPDAEHDARMPALGNLARPFWRSLPLLTLVVVAITVLGIMPQFLFGVVNDAVEEGKPVSDWLAVALVGLVAASAGLGWWFDLGAARLSNGMLFLLRVRLVDRLSRLGLAYYDRELPGYVATRVLHDLDEITGFARAVATRLVVTVLTLVVAVTGMAIVGTPLLWLILGVVGAAVLVTAVQIPLAWRAYLRERRALGDTIARLEEDYNGRAALDAAGATGAAIDAFDEVALELRRAQRWSACVSALASLALQWVAEIGGALILWRAGELVLGGTLTLGAMLTLRLFLGRALAPVLELGGLWQQFLRARVSFDRLRQPYEAEVLPHDRPDAVPAPALGGDIALVGVGFTYPGTDRRVFGDLTLTLPEQGTIALTGPTGAGKSTLAKLVARVYDPTEGSVQVGGYDLRTFTVASLRHRIGVVPQEPFLFAGTISDNVAYGKPEATPEERTAALDAVGARAALDTLGRTLDHPVLEEGINLTPQERQLIALARAWLVDPDILILDEATSALDDETEQRVLAALQSRRGATLFITHRDQVAAAADWRVVVDGDVHIEARPASAAVSLGALAEHP